MVLTGQHRIVLNRFMKRKDGEVRNYPLRMWVEIVDYARVGVMEFIATDKNVIFKRAYTLDNTTEGWVNCPELCVAFRGYGPATVFKAPESLMEEIQGDAHV